MNRRTLLSQSCIFGSSVSPRLPSAFQEVEYIESTGTQYIDTGYVSTQNITFDFKSTSNSGALFGADFNSGYGIAVVKASNFENFKIWSANAQINIHIVDNTILEVNIAMDTIDINGTIKSYTRNYSGALNYNLYLFARNRENSPMSYRASKLYYFKIYDNGTSVRDFVPCYRKADNVAGLYDLVNGVFYTNAGTGTFTKGNNVMYENN